MANVATMKSHGVEFTFLHEIFKTKDFGVDTDFIFLRQKMKLQTWNSDEKLLTWFPVQDLHLKVIGRGLFSYQFKG